VAESRWEPVIGLEVHVQLATASKAFSPSATRFGEPPNSLTDPTVLGLPGALPAFNRRALELAVRLGVACGCRIRPSSRFARKHYFYPDLPKGYQISQYDEPICEGGAVALGPRARSIALTRIHLEEDAGKSTHAGGSSLVDLNRAGVPLVEVVSEPVITSAAEAAAYMRALHGLIRWLEVGDGDMEKGNFRCDANVSLRPRGEARLGTRTELKNINSFRFVEDAINDEIARQAAILDGGGAIVQETRLWDADAGRSQSMRSKEDALDYRYFPDPDLPPLVVDDALVATTRDALPELPVARQRRWIDDLAIPEDAAAQLAGSRALADYFDATCRAAGASASEPARARPIANFVLADLARELNRDGSTIETCKVEPANLAELLALVERGVLSGKLARDVFAIMFASGEAPGPIVLREGLEQVSDSGAIEAACARLIEANPKQAAGFRAGNAKLLGFFVGQVMKEMGGKGNPAMINDVLKRLLDGPADG
jgi:aspartyl-tRNA(Asn)/glutamyl-tRNA(Gln) amidotransferase subunit B